MNIPIYRAKKIDSDEYVDGFLTQEVNVYKTNIEFFIVNIYETDSDINPFCEKYDEIDKTTLAIHFPEMIDSEGKKIFASLSEDGKGGDIVNYRDLKTDYTVVYFDEEDNSRFHCKNFKNIDDMGYKINPRLKIIGIQE